MTTEPIADRPRNAATPIRKTAVLDHDPMLELDEPPSLRRHPNTLRRASISRSNSLCSRTISLAQILHPLRHLRLFLGFLRGLTQSKSTVVLRCFIRQLETAIRALHEYRQRPYQAAPMG